MMLCQYSFVLIIIFSTQGGFENGKADASPRKPVDQDFINKLKCCHPPKVYGTGNRKLKRWSYMLEKNKCEWFYWSGKSKSRNVFNSKSACYNNCVGKDHSPLC